MATASSYQVAVDLSILIDLAEGHPFTHRAVERIRRDFGKGSLVAPHHVLAELAHASRRPEQDAVGICARVAESSLEAWKIARGVFASEQESQVRKAMAGLLRLESNEQLLSDVARLKCRILLTSDHDIISLSTSQEFKGVLEKAGLPPNFVVISPGEVNAM